MKKYCLSCENIVESYIGIGKIEFHWKYPEDHEHCDVECRGEFVEPEIIVLSDNWQDNLVEPDEDFMLISDQNADSLRLQFEGEEK
jgi:hypothetical protein